MEKGSWKRFCRFRRCASLLPVDWLLAFNAPLNLNKGRRVGMQAAMIPINSSRLSIIRISIKSMIHKLESSYNRNSRRSTEASFSSGLVIKLLCEWQLAPDVHVKSTEFGELYSTAATRRIIAGL